MKYQECFLMNQIYVAHPRERLPMKLCQRDEIADPEKLMKVIFTPGQLWRLIKINNHDTYYTRCVYDKRFYKDVHTSQFYIVTDNISLFDDIRNINDNPLRIYEFLMKHSSTLFMITVPVFHNNTTSYSISVDHTQTPIFLQHNNYSIQQLIQLINEQCYTICNGLTLFLAMVRANVLSYRNALIALRDWYNNENDDSDNNTNSIETNMNGLWDFLYINHPIPMIADFPIYYASMYPIIPTAFYEYLEQEDVVPLSQFIHESDNDVEQCTYASPITAMFPYFNREVIHYFHPNFTNNPASLLQVPFEFEENEDTQKIDIEGLLIGVLRSRHAWRWWKKNGVAYLRMIKDSHAEKFPFICYCFQMLFYLYTKPYHNIRYSRTRVRSIWNMMLAVFEIPVNDIQLFLILHIIKSVIHRHNDVLQYWNPSPPISFMLDLMKYYGHTFNIFHKQKYKIYSMTNADVFALIFAPFITSMQSITIENTEQADADNIAIEDQQWNYRFSCSLYQLLKIDGDFNHFVNILNKRIAKKLLCIEKFFGMKQDKRPLASIHENTAYQIGFVFKEYLRDHRNILV